MKLPVYRDAPEWQATMLNIKRTAIANLKETATAKNSDPLLLTINPYSSPENERFSL
jgi:hypothetical protein